MTLHVFMTGCLLALILALPNSGVAGDMTKRNFQHPQQVHVSGLPEGDGGSSISTEEPFISRDGRFLFFNTGHEEGNKDMHYAKWIGGLWVYQDVIGPDINTPEEVQGNPTMDDHHHFYFIDTTVPHMVQQGRFVPSTGKLEQVREFDGLPNRDVRLFAQRFTGNMGVELSPDGRVLYFSRATWDLNLWFPGEILASNILFSEWHGDGFIYDEKKAKRIMKNVNSDELEYAAGISKNGLELFFTRLTRESFRRGHPQSMIMQATRPNRNAAFGRPKEVRAVGHSDFVEGPSLSANERELYYHKHDGKKFRLFKVVR